MSLMSPPMDNKSRIVILCESYPSIAYTLYRLAQEGNKSHVTIFFPSLEDLYTLFQIINEKVFNNSIELIYYSQYTQRWAEAKGIRKLLYVLP